MSSLAYDHHSFCSFCRDFECTHDNRCEKCLLISDVQFAAYFKHQKSLKRKLIFKQKSKAKFGTVDTPLFPANDPVVMVSPSSVTYVDIDCDSPGVPPVLG